MNANNKERIVPFVLLIVSFLLYCVLGFLFLQKYPNYEFHLSGYDAFLPGIIRDPIVYSTATIRHPLLSLFMLPFHLLYLVFKTDYIILLVVAGFTAGANFFLYLIFRKIVGVNKWESLILSLLFISFAYILLMGIVPESYPFTLFLLVFSLYFIGTKMNRGAKLKTYLLLFFLTAGVTITNGLKILAGILFESISVRRKIIWISGILISFFVLVTPIYIVTKYLSSKEKTEMYQKQQEVNNQRKEEKQNSVKIIKIPAFMDFIDFETPYVPALIHNFIGESIIFHNAHLEQDVSSGRKPIESYSNPFYIVVSCCLFFLFIVSFLLNRKNKFVQYMACFWSVDVFIHVICRYALNEAYIFAPHWVMLIPIMLGYLLLKTSSKIRMVLTFCYALVAIFLLYINIDCLFMFLK